MQPPDNCPGVIANVMAKLDQLSDAMILLAQRPVVWGREPIQLSAVPVTPSYMQLGHQPSSQLSWYPKIGLSFYVHSDDTQMLLSLPDCGGGNDALPLALVPGLYLMCSRRKVKCLKRNLSKEEILPTKRSITQ
ncbi:hypothetical protein NDU88_008856 [Pleurodeles waltl]|uniref:Uncharacterized protein n=1 Tax=Pleurodeles waltl TaxID=8319 RepID=A0AAV7P1H2_PLEWA|nr:hypothetical protein NDU88_008856 [Pleurodeles waltl]